jgi:peptidoglycan/xylan/chitin deacetylase (PgdA/CDA1 family)
VPGLKRFKRMLLGASRTLGVDAIVRRSSWRRQRLTILCYHGVSLEDEHDWKPSYYMSVPTFRERMEILAENHYPVVPLGAGLRQLREGTLPQGAVALTFDDGMYDFHVNVAPVLEQFGFPATVYLTTFYSDFQRPVFDVFCSYVLWKGRERSLDLGTFVPGAGRVDLATDASRDAVLAELHRHARDQDIGAEGRDQLIDRIGEALQVDVAALRARRVLHVLTAGEARALADRGFDFQLHTHRHRVPVDHALFMRELEDNRSRLRHVSHAEATHFCYPSGVYRAEFLPWLQEAGVESATTCDAGLASAQTAPLLLPRVVDGAQLSPLEFEGWLSGVAAFLPRRPAGAAAR